MSIRVAGYELRVARFEVRISGLGILIVITRTSHRAPRNFEL